MSRCISGVRWRGHYVHCHHQEGHPGSHAARHGQTLVSWTWADQGKDLTPEPKQKAAADEDKQGGLF